jgi:hypothetical protein
MPFSESTGKPGEPSPLKAGSKSPAEFIAELRQRRAEREREDADQKQSSALRYLMGTGRAQTPEKAEQYLEAMGRIKEKLLFFALEQLCDPTSYDASGYSGIVRRNCDGKEAGFSTLTVNRIDRRDPYLWNLTRQFGPGASRLLPQDWESNRQQFDAIRNIAAFGEELHLGLDGGRAEIVIQSGIDGLMAKRLRGYLTESEVAFLRQEFLFASEDLARALRALGTYISEHPDESREWHSVLGEPSPRKLDPQPTLHQRGQENEGV